VITFTTISPALVDGTGASDGEVLDPVTDLQHGRVNNVGSRLQVMLAIVTQGDEYLVLNNHGNYTRKS
jgi:hypothetical protein